jgi:hypothetical protein
MRRLLAGLLGGLLATTLLSGGGPVPARSGPALVVPAASKALPASWHQVFRVGFGNRRSLLGTAPGGDSGTLRIGPEYGAAGPDGSWWFLDAAKRRLAHYSATGHYLGQVRVPRRLLVGGRYFQWQLPHVLANGWLLAARQGAGGTHLLRLRGTELDEIAVRGPTIFPVYDDGRRLYGYAGRRLLSVNPRTGATKRVAQQRTPSGQPFSVSVGRRLEVDRPAGSLTARLTTASGARAHVGLQVRAGADDTLHLFMTGLGEDDESVQLVGFTSLSPAGVLGPVEALPNPFSEADPGSPAQLVVAPGSSRPMLVYVLADGVHVYERSQP